MRPPRPITMRHEESKAQRSLITWWKLAHRGLGVPWEELLFSIPNEGKRGQIEGGRMKAMGLRPGAPDLMLAVPRGGYGGLFIELKTPSGRVSEEQKRFHSWLIGAGYWVKVARGWDQARAEIEAYLKGAKS